MLFIGFSVGAEAFNRMIPIPSLLDNGSQALSLKAIYTQIRAPQLSWPPSLGQTIISKKVVVP